MNPPPLKVALTGGIAAGKSTVAGMFQDLGVTVIDADVVAREVVAPGQPLLAEVIARFGADVAAPDGSLRRDRLRAIIAADPAARRRLEALLHPEINRIVWERAAMARGPYCIVVVPLLFETAQAQRADRILVVDAPESVQCQRVMSRDGVDLAGARGMIAAQAGRAVRRAGADDVIENHGDTAALQRAVERLHVRYLELAALRLPS